MVHPTELTLALRTHLRRHNLHVLGVSLVTLLTAVGLWLVLYGAAYWLSLFGLTVVRGAEAAVPADFRLRFGIAAAALLGIALFHRWLTPQGPPPDRKPLSAILFDFALAIPRTTLAVWGNLSAWQHLDAGELSLAAGLVTEVAQNQRLPLQSTPLIIPDDHVREKVVFALLLLHVLEVRRDAGVHWLHLSPLRSEALQALTNGMEALQ